MADPSDPGDAHGLAGRFYPRGTVCPDCGYSMNGCSATCCPECGVVTSDVAYPGLERPISAPERECADGLSFQASPWAIVAAARESINQFVGVLVLLSILGFVVLPILRSVDRMDNPVTVALRAAGTTGAVLGAFGILHAITTWWRLCRLARARRVALADDLAEGRVEEYHYEPTHAMRISDRDGECLLARFYGGAVFGLRPAAMRRLGLSPDVTVGQRARLAMLPRSRALVAVHFEGTGVPTSRRPDLRLRRAHPGAGDPVLSAQGVDALLRIRRGARPAFAPDGPAARASAW